MVKKRCPARARCTNISPLCCAVQHEKRGQSPAALIGFLCHTAFWLFPLLGSVIIVL